MKLLNPHGCASVTVEDMEHAVEEIAQNSERDGPMDKKEASTVCNLNPDTPLDMLRRVLAVAEIVAKSMPPVPSNAPEMGKKSQKV